MKAEPCGQGDSQKEWVEQSRNCEGEQDTKGDTPPKWNPTESGQSQNRRNDEEDDQDVTYDGCAQRDSALFLIPKPAVRTLFPQTKAPPAHLSGLPGITRMKARAPASGTGSSQAPADRESTRWNGSGSFSVMISSDLVVCDH